MNKLWKYIIMSSAVVISAIVLAVAYTNKSRSESGTISVTGLGETEFTSDMIVINGNITVSNVDAAEGYRLIEQDRRRVMEFLNSRGVATENVSFSMLRTDKQWTSFFEEGNYMGERFSHYELSQAFTIESQSVDMVETAARELTSLIGEGISISVSEPMYYYTMLDDVKHTLIAEAAADARARAELIASNSGVELEALSSSRAGVFQITAATGDEEFSAGGSFNLSSRDKKARVTVRSEYKIKSK